MSVIKKEVREVWHYDYGVRGLNVYTHYSEYTRKENIVFEALVQRTMRDREKPELKPIVAVSIPKEEAKRLADWLKTL